MKPDNLANYRDWAVENFPEMNVDEMTMVNRYFSKPYFDTYWVVFFVAPDEGHLGYCVLQWSPSMRYWYIREWYTNYFQKVKYNETTRSRSGIYGNPSFDSYVERSSDSYGEARQT